LRRIAETGEAGRQAKARASQQFRGRHVALGGAPRAVDAQTRGENVMSKIGRLTSVALVAILAALCGAPSAAPAQNYPNHTVTLVVPNAPGGPMDILARLFAKQLQAQWQQSVVVVYKPGAGTAVGTEFVAKSAPDGHTIGLVVTAHVINPSVRPNLPFDTVRDLAGVTLTAVSHIVIEATPSLPINTVPELIAHAKKNRGKLTFATAGSGSSMHLAGELLKTKAGIDMVHVPYKSERLV
jgi:tripartite-type tricarboxylate transporter receptor subunit TctC